jgi:hypothetical protein
MGNEAHCGHPLKLSSFSDALCGSNPFPLGVTNLSNQQANTQNQPAVPDGQPAENSVYSISATWPPVPWPPQLVTKLSSLLPGQPTPPVSAVMHRYASWGTRLAATLIDSLIVGAGAFMLSIVAFSRLSPSRS